MNARIQPPLAPPTARGALLLGLAALLATLFWPPPTHADDFDLGVLLGDLGSQSDFDLAIATLDDLHDAVSSAAYAFPRQHGGSLGLTGFELWVEATWDEEFANQPYAPRGLAEGLPLDGLSVARVGARKGLPGGLDIGASWARLLGTDLDMVGAEMQWSVIDGGILKPALALRLTGMQSSGEDEYDLEQYGATLILSKGFANVTPYVGGGVVRSNGEFKVTSAALDGVPPILAPLLDDEGDLRIDSDETQTVVFAGVRINLLVPRITVALEKTRNWQAAVRLSIGF